MKLPVGESNIWHLETHLELEAGLWIVRTCVHIQMKQNIMLLL